MYTYSISDLNRHEDALHETLHDIQVAETNGQHDIADDLRGVLDDLRFYIAEFKNAGISHEFPAGEFAVVGVNVAAHYDSYEREDW